LVVSRFGRVPAAGERIELAGVEVTVLEGSATAVVSVALRRPATEPKRVLR
jgi:Mg2+/Co2+ transporter CorC